MRRVSSSPGNLHRTSPRKAKPVSHASLIRSTLLNAGAVGLALLFVCNARAIGSALSDALPAAGSLDAAMARYSAASESAVDCASRLPSIPFWRP